MKIKPIPKVLEKLGLKKETKNKHLQRRYVQKIYIIRSLSGSMSKMCMGKHVRLGHKVKESIKC